MSSRYPHCTINLSVLKPNLKWNNIFLKVTIKRRHDLKVAKTLFLGMPCSRGWGDLWYHQDSEFGSQQREVCEETSKTHWAKWCNTQGMKFVHTPYSKPPSLDVMYFFQYDSHLWRFARHNYFCSSIYKKAYQQSNSLDPFAYSQNLHWFAWKLNFL